MKTQKPLILAAILMAAAPATMAGLIIDPASEYTSWARTTSWGHNNTSTGVITLPGSGSKVATQYAGLNTLTTRNRSSTSYTGTASGDGGAFVFDWVHDPNAEGNVRSFGSIHFSIDSAYDYSIAGFYDFVGSGTFGGPESEFTVRLTDSVSTVDIVHITLTGDGDDDLTLSGAGLGGTLTAGDYSLTFFSRIRDTTGNDNIDRSGQLSFSMASSVDTPATGLALALGLTAIIWRRANRHPD